MKSISVNLIVFFLLCASWMESTSAEDEPRATTAGMWSKIIHTGEVIGIAIKDDDLYGVGTDKKIWKHSLSGSGGWSKIIDDGEVIAIAIKDNDLYGVGNDKHIWKHSLSGSGGWSSVIDNGEFTAIAIKDNDLYGVDMDKKVLKHSLIEANLNEGWGKIFFSGEMIGIAIQDNDMYGVGTDNQIWKNYIRFFGTWSPWTKIIYDGQLTGIAIKDNDLYGIAMDKQIWKYSIAEIRKENQFVCPEWDGWLGFGQNWCYQLFTCQKNFSNSRRKCQSLDADMVSIHSAREQDFVYNLIKEKCTPTWLGANFKSEGQYEWADGTAFNYKNTISKNNWMTCGPDSGSCQGQVYMDKSGKWYDDSGESKYNIVCKKQATKANSNG